MKNILKERGPFKAFFSIQKYSQGCKRFRETRYEIDVTLHHTYKRFKFLALGWL